MKITDVRYIALQYPLETPLQFSWGPMTHRNFGLVLVETDAGITGLGESSVNFPHWALHERRVTIEQGLRPLLLGEDPLRIEAVWHKLYTAFLRLGILWGKAAVMSAIGAVDIALWDIAGKAYGLPVYQMLGGLATSSIPLYATGIDARQARRYFDEGFEAVKVRIGFGEARDVELLTSVREQIGYDARLLADVNMGWTLEQAREMLGWLEDIDLYWLEEPLRADDHAGYRRLAELTSLPLAAGENAFDRRDAHEVLETEALRYLMPDPTRAGGLTECKKICAIATAHHVTVSPHHYGSDVGFAAALHLLATVPDGGYMLRDVSNAPLREQVLRKPLRIANGYAELPEGPGLGIELNWEMIERYAVAPP